MTQPSISSIVEKLTEAQRDLLLRYEPTLTDQRITEEECFDKDCELFVELRPPAYEDGCMVYPGEQVWLASMSAHSPAGSPNWDECFVRYSEIGLQVRAHLLARGEGR